MIVSKADAMADVLALLALLIGLEMVLGVDNVLVITIDVTLFMEGLHKHVSRAYIYLPMGFALLVELLQM